MEIISSVNNPLIKELKKQQSKGLLFLDTPKLIKEAYQSGVIFDYILIQKGLEFDFVKEINTKIVYVTSSIISSLSTVKTCAGIIAVSKGYIKEFEYPKNNFLVLDNLQDAGNVGTLIRSALGANFKDIYLINCAKINTEKVVRSSMGAIFSTNCYEISRDEFVSKFKDKFYLYCCDMNGKDIYNFSFKSNCGIVIGNEGNGVSEEIRNLCSQTIKIPMQNNLESLNASISGSIIMYEIANRR